MGVVSFARSTPAPPCQETAAVAPVECAIVRTASAPTAGVRKAARSKHVVDFGPEFNIRTRPRLDMCNGIDWTEMDSGLDRSDQDWTGRKMINMDFFPKTCCIVEMKQKYFNKYFGKWKGLNDW